MALLLVNFQSNKQTLIHLRAILTVTVNNDDHAQTPFVIFRNELGSITVV